MPDEKTYRPEYRQSWAIVIGVNAYAHLPPLQFAVNDARLLAETLRSACGFPAENILLLEEAAATRDEILSAFRRTFANPRERRVSPDDRVLFFFAGHGLTRVKFDGALSGYLALAEAAGPDDWGACLGLEELLDEAQYVPAKHILFVFDACFSGLALTRGGRATGRLAADLLTRRAVQALTAGMADQPVSDGAGHNSPFTAHLVNGLKGEAASTNGLLTASQLFQYVRDRVVSEPNSIQTPYFGNVQGDGDMVLTLPHQPALRPELRVLLESDQPRYRLIAVEDLRQQLLTGADAPLATLIRHELARLHTSDPAPDVRALAQEVLAKATQQINIRETARRLEAAEVAARLQAKAEATARRLQDELQLELMPGLTLKLARVPAGEFTMGSDPNQDLAFYDEETPPCKIILPTYLIGQTPVTVEQFAAFIQFTGYKTIAEREGGGWSFRDGKWGEVPGADWQHPFGPGSDVARKAQHPVTLVSWDDAVAFCLWASVMTGRDVHLPSEAEWEKAARGVEGRMWPWGNEPPTDQLCNFNMSVKDTTPVNHYSPRGDSPYGVADMAGNTWEWTASLWRPYPYRLDENREDIPRREARVVRGGSFHSAERRARCAFRQPRSPHNRLVHYGFRVCVRPSLIAGGTLS